MRLRTLASYFSTLAACAVLLAACGGGSDSGSVSSSVNTLPASSTLAGICTTTIEKAFVRSFVDETYLWYREVPASNPNNYSTAPAYFEVLKTTATTASGKPKDQFHWSQTTASWNDSSSGISQDYGIQWMVQKRTPPRSWIVAQVRANSPAAAAGILRGDKLTAIDGTDLVYGNTDAELAVLNEGLRPTKLAAHSFQFLRNTTAFTSTITPATVTVNTVNNVKTFLNAKGVVGYFTFDQHISKSEGELIQAINTLKASNVNQLVIDMRYNGGGLLSVASKLAYMVAGPARTQGKTFERLTFNDKLSKYNESWPFDNQSSSGAALPTLNLPAVTIITSHNTASASESVINSLRGVDVTVNLIGDTTTGKPYGFVPQDNCGYTYFAIQFQGVNHKGFGDYADGFAPTCAANDDFSQPLGSAQEGALATALNYLNTASCSASGSIQLRASTPERFELVRPASEGIRILDRRIGPL